MPYQYFTYRNNAITTLAGGLSDIGEILIVKSGTGALYPSEYPYLLVLENIVNGVVMKRELTKVIRRDGDTFKIERSAGYCMASDTSLTKTNTAFEFGTDDRVSLRFVEEELADMQEEILRLGAITLGDASDTQKGTPKLTTAPASPTNPLAVSELDTRLPTQAENDAMVGTSGTPGTGNEFVTETDPSILNNVALTGNQTVGGIKTFSSIPILPATLATGANEMVTKNYLDWLGAGTLTQDILLLGTSPTTVSGTVGRGIEFKANKDIMVKSATLYYQCTRCSLVDALTNTILETVTVVGGVATFTNTTIFTTGTQFYLVGDANGSSFLSYRLTFSYPVSGTNVDLQGGRIMPSTFEHPYGYNIYTITTASIT